MNEVKAKLSRLPVSSFKVRLLADQIRGKFVSEALDILNFSKKSSSKNLKKLLESAIANAEHNGLDIDNFLFSTGNNNLTSLNLSWQFKGNFYWGININFHEVLNEKELRHIESNFDADSP